MVGLGLGLGFLLGQRCQVPVGSGQRDELGEGSRLGEAWLLLALANRGFATITFTAGAAAENERDRHTITDLQQALAVRCTGQMYALVSTLLEACHQSPNFVYHSAQLVTRREAAFPLVGFEPVGDVRIVPFPAMPVGATDTRRLDLQDYAVFGC